jgi:hypothetical protein
MHEKCLPFLWCLQTSEWLSLRATETRPNGFMVSTNRSALMHAGLSADFLASFFSFLQRGQREGIARFPN